MSSRFWTQIASRSLKVGATKLRNIRNRFSERGDNRALTKAMGISRAWASATRLGQTSASTKMIALGLMVANARRMIGQKSSGLYITSIHSGAFRFAKANPVVVVVVR